MGGPQERAPIERDPIRRKLAVVFPGQAAHEPGIGRSLYENFPSAREVFEQADASLGYSITELCFDGPPEQLAQTEVAQAAIGTVCIAAYRAAKERCPNLQPTVGGGVSFGELTNLVAANVIDLPTFFRIVQERGAIMEGVGAICEETGTYPALYYPSFVTVAGTNSNLDETMKAWGKQGGRSRETGIQYPFHSPLMGEAEKRLRKFLGSISFQNPDYAIVLNATGKESTSGEEIKDALPDQLVHAVDVPRSVARMRQLGGEVFIEFSPKPFLGGLVGKVDEKIQGISVFDIDSVKELGEHIASGDISS